MVKNWLTFRKILFSKLLPMFMSHQITTLGLAVEPRASVYPPLTSVSIYGKVSIKHRYSPQGSDVTSQPRFVDIHWIFNIQFEGLTGQFWIRNVWIQFESQYEDYIDLPTKFQRVMTKLNGGKIIMKMEHFMALWSCLKIPGFWGSITSWFTL